MHPAYSVIVFTTASGAGYGLMAMLAIWALVEGPAPGTAFPVVSGLLAFALISVGLLSSTFHLGRPERAWRAFSQWRSSWLSREAVAAVVTYPVAGLFWLAWSFPETVPLPREPLAVLTLAACAVTVCCTAMIYNCLVTIRQWRHPLVTPVYLALGTASGAMLLLALARLFGTDPGWAAPAASFTGVGALLLKVLHWRSVDADPGRLTPGRATGLWRLGPVRQWEVPHTGENFVTREMGYRVARTHARRLRLIALAAVALGVVCAVLADMGSAGLLFALVAPVATGIGVLVERWLFFAEAEHVVGLYYGAERA